MQRYLAVLHNPRGAARGCASDYWYQTTTLGRALRGISPVRTVQSCAEQVSMRREGIVRG